MATTKVNTMQSQITLATQRQTGTYDKQVCEVLATEPTHNQNPHVLSRKPFSGKIREVCEIPSRCGNFTWSASDVAGTILASLPVSPLTMKSVTAANKTKYNTTNLGHFGVSYTYWRGSLHFTVEVIANKFYQGQLYVCFVPRKDTSAFNPADVSLNAAMNLGGAVLNLSEKNVTTLHVPYISPRDYSLCELQADFQSSTGHFLVYVLNPLVAGTQLAPSVDVNIDIAAGDDFCFAYPKAIDHSLAYYVNGVSVQPAEVRKVVGQTTRLIAQSDTRDFGLPTGRVANYVDDSQNVTHTVVNTSSVQPSASLEQEYMSVSRAFTIPTTQVIGVPTKFSMPSSFFDNEQYPAAVHKFHNLFRSDFKVNVRLQATPFHSGKVCVAYYPNPNATTNDILASELYATIRNLPHVMLNVNSQTQGEFVVPYSGGNRHVMSNKGTNSLTDYDTGYLVVYVYNQLKVARGGSPSINGQIAITPLNPEFAVRTVIPQMNLDSLPRNYVGELNEFVQAQHNCYSLKDTYQKYGADHTPVFVCTYIYRAHGADKEFSGIGHGLTKQEAKQKAAKNLLESIQPKEQMDARATMDATEREMTGEVNQPLTTLQDSYQPWMTVKENDIEELLRCYDFHCQLLDFGDEAAAGVEVLSAVTNFMAVPAIPSPEHARITSLFAFRSGSMDMQFVSYNSNEDSYLITQKPLKAKFVSPSDTPMKPIAITAWDVDTVGKPEDFTLYTNVPMVTWKSTIEPVKQINVPQISMSPLLRNSFSVEPNKLELNTASLGSVVYVAIMPPSITATSTFSSSKYALGVQSRIGHDFGLHYLSTAPVLELTTPAPVAASDEPEQFDSAFFEQDYPDIPYVRARRYPMIRFPNLYPGHDDPALDEQIEAGMDNWSLLALAGDVESNPGPTDIDPEAQGLVSQLVDFMLALAKSTVSSTASFMSDVVSGVVDCVDDIVTFLISKGMKLIFRRVTGQDFDRVKELVEYALDIFKSVTLLTWFTRKCYLVWKGVYSAYDCMSDLIILATSKMAGSIVTIFREHLTAQEQVLGNMDFFTMVVKVLGTFVFGLVGSSFDTGRGSVMNTIFTRVFSETGKAFHTMVSEAFDILIKYFVDGEPEEHIDVLKGYEEYVPQKIAQYYSLRSQGYFTGLSTNQTVETDDHPIIYLLKLKNLTEEIMPLILTSNKYAHWVTFCKDVQKEWEGLRKNQSVSVTRPEPIGIYIAGEPGQGKSFMATTLLPEILLCRLGIIKERSEAKYNQYNFPNNPDQSYADGYWGQPYVIYDDLGATREGKDFQQIINFISSAVAPINMADLKDKGQLFISSFLCATSNQLSTANVTSLNNPEALVRRFPFAIKIAVRPDFELNGKLHVAHLNDELRLHATSYQTELAVYERAFSVHKLNLNDGTLAENIPIRTFIDNIVEEYVNRHRNIKENENLRHSFKVPRYEPQIQGPELVGGMIREILLRTYRTGTVDMMSAELDRVVGLLDGMALPPVQDVVTELQQAFGNPLCMPIGRFVSKFLTYYQHSKNKFALAIGVLSRFKVDFFDYVTGNKIPCGLEHYVTVQQQTPTVYAEYFVNIHTTWNWNPTGTYRDLYWKGIYNYLIRLEACNGNKFSVFLSYCIDAGILLYIVYLVTVIVKKLFGYFFPPEEQVYAKETRKAARRPVKTPTKGVSAYQDDWQNPRPQILTDNDRVKHACMPFKLSEEGVVAGYVLVYNDNTVIMNRHYIKYIRANVNRYWLMTRNPQGELFEYKMMTLEHYVRLSFKEHETDLVLARVPMKLAGFRCLSRSLYSEKELDDKLQGLEQAAWLKLGYTTGREDQVCKIDGTRYLSYDSTKNYSVEFKTQQATKQGDCGTPYMSNGRIVAIHSVIDPVTGKLGGSMVSQESINRALEGLTAMGLPVEHVDFEVYPVENICVDPLWHSNENGYYMLGEAKGVDGTTMANFVPNTTQKIRSQLCDTETWPDGHKPTRKSHDILMTRCQKYEFLKPCEPPSLAETTFVLDYWESVLAKEPHDTRILSEEEILNGNDALTEMKRESSSGIWNKISKGKRDLLDVTYDEETGKAHLSLSKLAHEMKHPWLGMSFVDFIEHREKLGKQGIRSNQVFWTTCLKDELKPIEKVEAGKTRVFECAPFDSTYLIKKYFGAFAEWYRTHGGPVLSHFIGLEKEKYWHILYQHLKSGGKKNGLDIDYKEWDGSVPPAAFVFFEKLCSLYYHDQTDEERRMRSVLIHEIQFTQQLVADKMCLTQKGNKSGMWLTDMFNSICNHWGWMVSYHRLHFKTFGVRPTFQDWARDVSLFTLGDDATCSVDPAVESWFTPEKVIESLGQLGFEATPASKIGNDFSLKPIEELSFLKSHFNLEHFPIVLAPLPKEISYRELNWVKREFVENISVRKCMLKDAVTFMSHHGQKSYDEFVESIKKGLHREPMLALTDLEIQPFRTRLSEIWLKQQSVEPTEFVCKTYQDL